MFGKPVTLNIAGADTVNTLAGGLMSTIIVVLMITYVGKLVSAMIQHNADTIGYIWPVVDASTLGEVGLKENRIMQFHQLVRPFAHDRSAREAKHAEGED